MLICFQLYVSTYGCIYTEPMTNKTLYGSCNDIREITGFNHLQWIDAGHIRYGEPITIQEIDVKMALIKNTTPTTTTTTTIPCPPIPECVCTCPICSVCPQPQFERTTEEVKWLLNSCRIRDGATCYQSGSADTCDKILEYLQIPGRPKFKTRPSIGYTVLQTQQEDTYCFKNLGEYFIINRSTRVFNNSNGEMITRKQWGWNDNECLSSTLRINNL